MSRKLDDLDSKFKPIVFEFLARLTEAGIHVVIVDTLRTIEEQKENVLKGVSWTMSSKHLPQAPEMKSHAIDIAPYEEYKLHGPDKLQWNDKDPVWQRIGFVGQALGMKWGIVLSKKHTDLGHFEYIKDDSKKV
jgi:hypothetical protein